MNLSFTLTLTQEKGQHVHFSGRYIHFFEDSASLDRKKIVFFIPRRIRSPFLLPACISVLAVIHRLLLLSPASIYEIHKTGEKRELASFIFTFLIFSSGVNGRGEKERKMDGFGAGNSLGINE